jgi:hypothetical protein
LLHDFFVNRDQKSVLGEADVLATTLKIYRSATPKQAAACEKPFRLASYPRLNAN